jgi:hypothetical protein
MTALKEAIRAAFERYTREVDAAAVGRAQLELVKRFKLLPLSDEWTGFIGIPEDGTVFWVDQEAAVPTPTSDITPFTRHYAFVKGAKRHPELASFCPQPNESWVTCEICRGTGLLLEARTRGDSSCRCVGLGALPPDVHQFIQSTGRLF